MMTVKRWLVAGLATAGLLASVPARAGDESGKARSAGTVQKLDPSTGEITLAAPRGGATLMVTDGTEIRKDGRRATFSDLREGDEVRASFSGESRTVNKLEVTSGPDPFYHPSHDSP